MRALYNLLLVILLVSEVGCVSGAYEQLPSEYNDKLLNDLANRTVLHKKATHLFSTSAGGIPQMIAMHEYGPPEAERVVVLIHGCLADASGWRFVVGQLASDYQVLTVDLLGCGASDKPDMYAIGENGYSPEQLASRICEALQTHADRRNSTAKITLVGHSLGGAIALRMMSSPDLQERYTVLTHVDRVTLFSPLDVELPNLPSTLRELVETPFLQIQLGDMAGLLRNRIAEGVSESVCNPARALREEVDKIHRLLTHRKQLDALKAILMQAIPLDGDRLDWEESQRIVASYKNIEVPCLILWGERDDTLPISMGHKLAAQIPNAELHPVPDCKHSIQLELPILCAETVRTFSESELSQGIEFSLESVVAAINERRVQFEKGVRS